MSEIKYQKLDTLLKYLPKSKIKAGEGKEKGKCPFYTSSANLTKKIDIATYTDESIVLGSGGLASIHYVNQPFSTSTDCFVLTPIDENIDLKYVYYFLKTNMRILENGFKGVGLKHISKKYISNIKIPIIEPVENQRKISAFLTRLEELIAKREESIKLLDELIKSTFLDMFQDIIIKNTNIKTFNEIAVIDTNMVNDFIKYKDLPHIGIANIEKDTGKILNYKLVKDENIISGKYLFDERHILYSKIRPNLNKVALPDFKGLLSADAYPILPKENIVTREFLAYLLRSQYFLNYILSHSDRANIPKINKKALNGFACSIPDIDLQLTFSKRVKQINSSKKPYQKSLDELTNLFNSTAQKAFKGKLNVSKIGLEQTQQKEAVMKLDKEQILKLIKQGNFDPKDYITSESSYDDIRDMIIGTKGKIGLIDDGLVVQEFDKKLKKMVLKVKE